MNNKRKIKNKKKLSNLRNLDLASELIKTLSMPSSLADSASRWILDSTHSFAWKGQGQTCTG
jgi:hypothetical protein